VEFELLRAPSDRQQVQSYGPGWFLVSGVRHRGSILITAERVVALEATSLDAIDEAALAPLFEAGVDLVLLGTGGRFAVPPAGLLQALRARGIAFEPMTTPAACRTYNLLLAEERRVGAVLLALPG